MPNLSREQVHQFWSQYNDPMVYRVIAFMESVEQWTLDGNPDLEQALERLGHELDGIGNQDLGAEKQFIDITSHVSTGRALRLLQCIDTANPGAASKLLVHAEENSKSDTDPEGLFLRRNIVFERLRILARIFAPERLALVLRILEEGSDD